MSRPVVGVRDNSLIVANVCLFNCSMMRNHSASHLHNRCRVLGVERAKRARTFELAARSVVPNEAFPNPRTRNSTCFPARLTILMSAVLVLQIQCWTHGFFVFLVVGDAFACSLIPIRLIALFCLSFSSCSLAACKHCANRHLSRFGLGRIGVFILVPFMCFIINSDTKRRMHSPPHVKPAIPVLWVE